MSRCKHCETLNINGHSTHEIGCPAHPKSCKWCGSIYNPMDDGTSRDCCSHSCHVSYHNLDCDCHECCIPIDVNADD